MRRHRQRAFWRLARLWFRRVRITVWLGLLLLLAVLIYLNQVGLPGFLQGPVIRAFQKQGLDLDFSRLRLSWYKGLVADDVVLQPASAEWAPRMECRQLDLRFRAAALLRLGLAVESITVTDGRLSLPYGQSNAASSMLTVTNIDSQVSFTPGGEWRLGSFQGEVDGCQLLVSGMITNPAAIRDWRILRARTQPSHGVPADIVRQVHDALGSFQFGTAPKLYLGFSLDGNAPDAMSIWFSVQAARAVSDWLELEDAQFFARMDAVPPQGCSQVDVTFQARRAAGPNVHGQGLNLHGSLTCIPDEGRMLSGHLSVAADRIDTRWFGAVEMEGTTDWTGNGTNWLPATVSTSVHAHECSTQWGLAKRSEIKLSVTPFTGDYRCIAELPPVVFPRLLPYSLTAEVAAEHIETPWLSVTNFHTSAGWNAPVLSVSNLNADLCRGHLETSAHLDVATGRLNVRLASDLDPHGLSPVLSPQAIRWLGRYTWEDPPVVWGTGEVTFPKWHPYDLLWPGDLRPDMQLSGGFEVGPGTFRTVPVSGASGHLTYSNMFWHLPDLRIRQPHSAFQLEHVNNDRTHDYWFRVNGPVDPTPAFRLLPEHVRQKLATLQLGGPAEAHFEINGRWHHPELIHVQGAVHATNLTFRGCTFDDVRAALDYTNEVLEVRDPSARQVEQAASASALTFDFPRQRAFLSNGVSTLPPLVIATIIGPHVVHVVEPFRFLNPPSAHVDGVIPLHGVQGADLRFQIEGGPFEWWRFRLPSIRSLVHWRDETVLLTNMQASFYGGNAQGAALFDFTGKKDADFHFALSVQDADLRSLVAGVFKSKKRLEGQLSGQLVVTNANTGDMGSWFGYGSAELQNGFIWDVPVFGIVSPVLNMIVPGLGNSKAKEAKGTYTITNSVIRTDDLVIRTSNMRLNYKGTVDFNGVVDARAEAEILRDTFAIGEFVSTMLTPVSKALVLRITGTLSDPKAEPLYFVPRLLAVPLNPIKFFKNIFEPPAPEYKPLPSDIPGPDTSTNTPAPPPESGQSDGN